MDALERKIQKLEELRERPQSPETARRLDFLLNVLEKETGQTAHAVAPQSAAAGNTSA